MSLKKAFDFCAILTYLRYLDVYFNIAWPIKTGLGGKRLHLQLSALRLPKSFAKNNIKHH